jgi:methionine synthase I (cobalamin-dependent)/5,10-methylenetetrahydrofolate reductase
MKPDLRKKLSNSILVGDGAMGTYLYQIGFPVGISYEELNLSQPEIIERVHREYYEAGARFIETNTYSANRERLSKFGLEAEVEQINRAGVEIARRAVGSDAYVIGAVGSIRAGKRKNIRTTQIEADFEQQIEALTGSTIDGILLETFYDLDELLIALQITRKYTDLSVICQLAMEDVGRTSDGFPGSEAFERLIASGADVVGLNCRTGPNGIMRVLEKTMIAPNVPISVFPNAGIPDYIDGRYRYVSTPAYFAESAIRFANLGARVIGGCCGTTPEHIKAMAEALTGYVSNERLDNQNQGTVERLLSRNNGIGSSGITITEPTKNSDIVVPPGDELSIVELVKKRHTVIVELDPPRDLDISKFMTGAAALRDARADAITMADNSLAVTRMSNLALGNLIKDKLGIRPLIHIACRDRNLIGTQSHLMGLDALGIDHVLAVTGDPAKFGDLPGSSSVYDLTSFEIIRMIKQLNEGTAFSGKPLKQKAKFIVGAAFNPNVKHLDKAVQRLERKVKAGADYIMTQPVYDPLLMERVHEMTRHLDVPIFIGIMPLATGRNAEYLHNEVPGIQLSDEVRHRMNGLEKEEGRLMGNQIAKELLDAAMPLFNGIYIITPFLNYEMSVDLTRYVWQKAPILS